MTEQPIPPAQRRAHVANRCLRIAQKEGLEIALVVAGPGDDDGAHVVGSGTDVEALALLRGTLAKLDPDAGDST